jgi:hypothetical protein
MVVFKALVDSVPFVQMWANAFEHPDIYKEAYKRMNKFYEKNSSYMCSCAK